MLPHFKSLWKIITKKSQNKKQFQRKVTLRRQKQNLLRNAHIKGKYFILCYLRRNILLRGVLLIGNISSLVIFVNKRPFTFTSS